jgi:hypothetical protein
MAMALFFFRREPLFVLACTSESKRINKDSFS